MLKKRKFKCELWGWWQGGNSSQLFHVELRRECNLVERKEVVGKESGDIRIRIVNNLRSKCAKIWELMEMACKWFTILFLCAELSGIIWNFFLRILRGYEMAKIKLNDRKGIWISPRCCVNNLGRILKCEGWW